MNIVALSLSTLLYTGVSFATPSDKFAITPAEHAACDQDAASLCAESYPDEDKLLACMKAKRPQLSSACSVAFEAGLKKRHMTP